MLAAQILAIIIFVAMFVFIVLDKFERHYVTLISGGLVIALVFGALMQDTNAIVETLNLQCIGTQEFWYGASSESTSGINWSTIIFICGMMIMVEGLGKAGFFRWLCLLLAKVAKYKAVPLLILFMIMSAVLAMFIDSITVVLFLAAVTIELSRVLKFNPVPIIIAEIFCANLGGAATMCGDPPNIIIGTSLGLSFFDFLTNTGTVVLICIGVVVLYYFLIFRKQLNKSDEERPKDIEYPQPSSAVNNNKFFVASICIFAAAVILLVTHAQTTLTVAFIGVIIAAATYLLTLITSGKENVGYITKHIDYKTLLFFVGLFITVGGLEQTGILVILAEFIGDISGGDFMAMLAIVLWISAICSAFIDNIPFAATMVPVIQSMAATQGVPLNSLAYALALGTDIGGNGTPIGASANVVGTSVAAKAGHPIGWGKYCKYNVPITLIVLAICTVYLYFRYAVGV